MKEPYIFVSGHTSHYGEIWDHTGVQIVEERGYHAIFVMTVPFIPSFRSEDFLRSLGGGMGRIKQIVLRQLRFLNDLTNARHIAEGAVAFDLRFIARPAPTVDQHGTIEIAFLGKVFHPNRREAERLARVVWQKFLSHYPLEDPFNYPLLPVDQESFTSYLLPIPVGEISAENVLEIRKYEDYDPLLAQSSVGYFPHPFEPVMDFSAMARFIETMAMSTQPCVVSICIRPTQLLDGELQALNQVLTTYDRLTREAAQTQGWLALYRQERLDDLRRTFEPTINQRNHLFMIKVQVIGAESPPLAVIESLGSEFMNNVSPEPRTWARQIVGNQKDLQIALHNFQFLEHRMWGEIHNDAQMCRIRSLVTAYEAAGAFRLPIPPESGYMPGLIIKDEPFVMPTELISNDQILVTLGEIIHRGQKSGIPFNISVSELTRHALIGGSTGSGKTNTCLHLLSSLWSSYGVPFLVLYPIDKPDYRLLMADPKIRDDLLIFTVGDENASPFRFNPFAVPEGILLKTHISQLMRCFAAAFTMWDPLPAIYRAALRRVYQDCGWDVLSGCGGAGIRTPTMAQFYDAIVVCADTLTADYGREVRGNVKQGAEIRIRDLLENMGHVINTPDSAPFTEIMARPTVMELGRVGSTEDTALIMGFVLMQVSATLQSRFKKLEPAARKRNIHLTLVEEAHRLMSRGHNSSDQTADARAKGGEDFANLLAEVRGYGEGILIAEQIPTNLVAGAVGNTHLKIMHWLEDTDSFNLFCDVMNLDERQRDYVRTLDRGHVVVRGRNGSPVHVKVVNYLDSFQDESDYTTIDDSDAALRTFMRNRIQLPPAQTWTPSSPSNPVSSNRQPGVPVHNSVHQHSEECRRDPTTCSFYSVAVAIPTKREDLNAIIKAAQQLDWETVRKICYGRMQSSDIASDSLAGYCYLYMLSRCRVPNSNQRMLEHIPEIQTALKQFFVTQEAR